MGSTAMSRVDGKNALVTGAGQCLGKAFALALAEAGANVALAVIRYEAVTSAAAEIAQTGRKSLAIAADISRNNQVECMVKEVIREWGRLDIAVNNVGVSLPIKDALQITEEE